jgi:hypothetical protein
MKLIYESDSCHSFGAEELRRWAAGKLNVTVRQGGKTIEGEIRGVGTDHNGFIGVFIASRLDDDWVTFDDLLFVSSHGDDDFSVTLH